MLFYIVKLEYCFPSRSRGPRLTPNYPQLSLLGLSLPIWKIQKLPPEFVCTVFKSGQRYEALRFSRATLAYVCGSHGLTCAGSRISGKGGIIIYFSGSSLST